MFKVGLATCHLSYNEAKQCALIATKEMLNEGKMKFCGDGIRDVHYIFWKDVYDILIK